MSAISLLTSSGTGSKRNRKGREPAIAGVLALGGVALAMTLVIGGVSGHVDEDPDQRMSGAGDRSAVSLAVGDCFTSSQHGEVYSAVPVPCSQPHDGEVFATVALTGSSGAGDALAKQSYHQCSDRLTGYVMDDWSLPHTMGVNYYYPTREVQSGSRTATCFAADTDGRTTGSVRERETSLTADQLAFLRLELASARVLKTYPHLGSVADNRAWAAKMAAALDHEADGLEAVNWSVGARPKVTAYVGELRRSAELWRKAVAARSDNNYGDRSDDAWDHPSHEYQREVRKTLGLASDVPATSFGPPF